ncbi:interleukin-1 receptor-associated kinase 4-like protein, partial [Leptotrombidium deliense]
GRKRPKIQDLIDNLVKCNLNIAADYVSVNILHGKPVNIDCDDNKLGNSDFESMNSELQLTQKYNESVWSHNESVKKCTSSIKPSLVIPTAPNLSSLSIEDNSACDDVSDILSNYSEIRRFSFSQVSLVTNHFAEISIKDGGCKIGEGAFGSVFVACLPSNETLAVKRLKNDFKNQFLNELKILTKFKHENLLPLLGIACEGPVLCLIYEYMVNGSLLDRISCVDNSTPISWKERMNITLKVCDGICHLHSFDEKPYIHRDIKSANILLDKHLNPKIGDFGLARIGSQPGNEMTKSSAKTTNIIGTSVYMAPEAFRGDISVKLDTFSFGVVMLELLTGLSPYDCEREEADVLSYVEEHILGEFDEDEIDEQRLQPFLDKKAGNWDTTVAVKYFKLSRCATEQRKKNRPTTLQLKDLFIDNELHSIKPVCN